MMMRRMMVKMSEEEKGAFDVLEEAAHRDHLSRVDLQQARLFDGHTSHSSRMHAR